MQRSHETSTPPLRAVSPKRPVLVVGGGMAGLTTAWRLQQRGVPVRVLEATAHAGGRVQSVEEQGGLLETGMQFYYSTYRQTHRLLREVGLDKSLFPIHLQGRMAWNGRVERFSKQNPWLRHLSGQDNLRLELSLARQLPALVTRSTFGYREGDPLGNVDVAEHFTRHGDDAILEVAIRPMVNSYAFCEPEGHSLGMLLRIVKLGALAKMYGLARGNDGLARALASRLDVARGRVQRVLLEGGRVQGVVWERDGRREALPAPVVVCAVGGPAAAKLLRGAPQVAEGMDALSYSSIVLCNLHLDRALEGDEWVYVHSRKAGHQAAFAVDLLRRGPAMFPGGKSVIQVDFASPVSDGLLPKTDDEIAEQATRDMEAFFPEIASWVTHRSVVRRARCHPNFAVGMADRVRQVQRDAASLEGLYLAGDYLRTPLCEGAVRSGTDCARQILGGGRRGAAASIRAPRSEAVLAGAAI